jgi:disulfide bond formation protein DsbB
MTYVAVTRSLSTLALASAAAGLLLLLLLVLPGGRTFLHRKLTGDERGLLLLAWVTALGATLGSLYYSEVVGFPPCLLCWYQRIAMYPLVLILGAGVIRADAGVWRYGLPLSVVGLVIAAYHVAIQRRPALDVVTCDAAAPCTVRYVAAYGFVSIPFMAACGFLLISAVLLASRTLEAPNDRR